MRVEIDVQPLGRGFTGVSTYLRNLIGELRVRHADVRLGFIADHPVVELEPDVPSLIGPAVTNMKTKLIWEALRLPAHSFFSRPDILHSPYHSATWTGRGRRVMTVHDCHLWTVPPANRAERVYRAALCHAARRADLVLTDSDFSAGQIETLLRVNPARVHVVPLACSPDIPQVRMTEELDALRLRYGLERPFILYAGGTAAYKGVGTLVEAYARLHQDLREMFDLVILGRLDRAIVHHLPIIDAIASLGPGRSVPPGIVPQGELGAFYQAAQVFVFPSSYEGFGLSPLEAMACGAPVIASNRASIPEVVGSAAILVDPVDPDAITTALERVLSDRDLQATMRRASIERATHFSWARTADMTRAAYDEVLAR